MSHMTQVGAKKSAPAPRPLVRNLPSRVHGSVRGDWERLLGNRLRGAMTGEAAQPRRCSCGGTCDSCSKEEDQPLRELLARLPGPLRKSLESGTDDEQEILGAPSRGEASCGLRERLDHDKRPHQGAATIVCDGAGDIKTFQRTVGTQAVQRMLGERDRHCDQEVGGQVNAPHAPLAQQGETQEEQLLVIPEEFTPIEYTVLPDESSQELASVSSEGPREEPTTEEMPAVAAPPLGFHDVGRTGTARLGDEPVLDVSYPRAFTDGGMTGTVVWAGGGGAGPHGNQAAGSVQAQVAPVYQATPVAAGTSTASVQAGTGRLDVTRSWVGANGGDQGNGYYVTAGAAARFNTHERLHVTSTRGHYDTNIVPLLARATTTQSAATQAAAIAALTAHVNWPASVTAFQNADIASNTPMGTVDVADKGSGTYPVDAGPGTVGGTPFTHRVRLPSEPNPT
jgi:hypothetical protein